jgi:hypothetical protein
MVMINGAPAWTMFDTGSTADCIAPEFARVHGCKTFDLESPVPLQLGTKGSKSTITYGTNVEVKPAGSLTTVEYMDIINIDRYDAILGIPYMSKHGIVLNLRARTIQFPDGTIVPSLNSEDEARYRGRPTTHPQGSQPQPSSIPEATKRKGPKLPGKENPISRRHGPAAGNENILAANVPKVLKVAGRRIPRHTTMATQGDSTGRSSISLPEGKSSSR